MVIPEGWESAELGEICTKIGSGKTPHGGESVYTIAGIMLIRSQNVDNGKMLLADVAYILKSRELYLGWNTHIHC